MVTRWGRAQRIILQFAIIALLIALAPMNAFAAGKLFQSAPAVASGATPYGVAAGDFNGDGIDDVAVANYNSGSVSIELGNGDGTFQPAVNYPIAGSYPTAVAAGDFNGDGVEDLAVTDVASGQVIILLGNAKNGKGDGTFQTGAGIVVGNNPRAIVAGDFNKDGKMDLAVANSFSNDVAILLGNGDGTFHPPVNYAVGTYPQSIAVKDLDNDGYPDLAVANYNSQNVSVLLADKNAPGSFNAAVNYSAGAGCVSVALEDFNGDTKPDLAIVSLSGIFILPGFGDGTFDSANKIYNATETAPWASVAGDFNGDGKLDLAVTNYYSNSVSVLLGNGDGTLQTSKTAQYVLNFHANSKPIFLVSGHFNADSHLDLAVADSNTNEVSVLLGNGDGTLQAPVSLGLFNGPSAVAVADFNQDGNPDMAVTNTFSYRVSVLPGNGDGTFGLNEPDLQLGSNNNPLSLATGDFNKDGNPDLAVGYFNPASSKGFVDIYFGNGDGTFQSSPNTIFLGFNAYPTSIAVEDLDEDGYPELLIANDGSDNVVVIVGAGGVASYPAGSNPYAVIGGDFDKDGHKDLAIANKNSNDVTVIFTDGHGNMQSSRNYTVGTNPEAIATGDFNHDGYLDLVVANNGSNNVTILLGDKQNPGTFITGGTYSVGPSPQSIAVGDFDGDGKLDAAVANYGSDGYQDISVLLGNGDGTFQAADDYGTGLVGNNTQSGSSAVAAADFNKNGKIDLAVATFVNNRVAIFEAANATQPGSTNADLAGLSLSAGTLTPGFDPNTTSYTASVANSVKSITITPTAADSMATITVNGQSVTSGTASAGINLNVGSNPITVVVTAQDGTTTISYTINVTRAVPPIINPPSYYPVTDVTLNKTKLTLKAGGAAETLTATVLPDYATNKQVTWQSSNPSVAAVDQNGVVTPLSEGEATITVTTTDQAKTATCEVTVTSQHEQVVGIKVSEKNIMIKPNKSLQLKVMAVYANGETKEITTDENTKYSSSSKNVTVEAGLITAGKREGKAKIKVKYLNNTVTVPITVSKRTVKELTSEISDVQLGLNETRQLQVTALFSDGKMKDVTDLAVWSSDNEQTATVNEKGEVTAEDEGTALITADYGGKTMTFSVEVAAPKNVKKLTASTKRLTLTKGEEQQVELTATYADGSEKSVTSHAKWSTTVENVATVKNGLITAVSEGSARIKAKYGGKTVTISILVKE